MTDAVHHHAMGVTTGQGETLPNKTLAKLVADWMDKKFMGARAKKRPDLFLAVVERDEHLLIEFKEPSHAITRDDENQAVKYRDDLQPFVPDKKIEILVIGAARAPVATQYTTTGLTVASYVGLSAHARDELGWLLEHLRSA
jgi:hypothetical protein